MSAARDQIYLRPVGILHGAAADQALAAGQALPLAGGPAAFSAVAVLRRASQHCSPVLPITDARTGDFAPLLERLAGRRTPVGGLDFARPLVLGIVNVTPDSFSDGGEHADPAAALDHAQKLLAAGADGVDIGGESTRPGADPVPPDVECDRVVAVVRAVAALGRPVSIDTRRPRVMRAAVAAGATMINDVSALTHDPGSLDAAAALGVPLVLMHSQGEPKTMQEAPDYEDVLLDVYDYLEERIRCCLGRGIDRSRIVVDPGIGFGKTLAHNLHLLRGLSLFHGLGQPILLGASRKGLIGRLSRGEPPSGRLGGSLALALHAVSQGIQVLRVHDVAETVQAVKLWRALAEGGPDSAPWV